MSNKNNNSVIVAFVFVVIGLVIFKIIPIMSDILLSFKEYHLVSGRAGSPWAGSVNYQRVINSFVFPQLIRNTLFYKLAITVLTTIGATIFLLLLSRVKSQRIKAIFAMGLSIPMVIPTLVIVNIIFQFMKPGDSIILIEKYSVIYSGLASIKLTGLVVLLGWLLFLNKKGVQSIKKVGMAIGIFLLFSLATILSVDTELTHTLYNPMVYEKADIIDTYVFRSGIQNMDISASLSVWGLKYDIQLLLGAVAIFVGYLLIQKGKKVDLNDYNEGSQSAVVGSAVFSIAFIAGAIYICTKGGDEQLTRAVMGQTPYVMWLALTVVTACISVVITSLFAYPLYSKNKRIHVVYLAVICICITGQSAVGQYLKFRELGIYNTIYPVILTNILPMWMVIVYGIQALQESKTTTNYINSILPSAIVLSGIQFCNMWGSYFKPMLFISQPNYMTPTLLMRQATLGGQVEKVGNGAVLIPILIVWGVVAFALAMLYRTVNKEHVERE